MKILILCSSGNMSLVHVHSFLDFVKIIFLYDILAYFYFEQKLEAYWDKGSTCT